MANTYTLINSTSLSSSAASVTFSSIPATYDDLEIVASARSDANFVYSGIKYRVNSLSTSIYSGTDLYGDGSSATSSRESNQTKGGRFTVIAGANATSNTFGSTSIYIPKYTSSENKPIGSFSTGETNATTSYLAVEADLIRTTAAITSIEITDYFSGNFVSGSTFWLYGIKNS